MSGYRHGADLERAAKKHLEANGYYVIKSGGSKGIVDLAAFKPGEVMFVQCKLDGYLAPAERMNIWRLTARVGAWPLVASWHKDGRAARQVLIERIDGAHGGRSPWTPDYALEAS